MTRQVLWTARAAAQLRDAVAYLDAARTGSGLGMLTAVRKLLEWAALRPHMHPRVKGVSGNPVRRGLVRRYGYWVIYEVRRADLLVLSIWHGRQAPDGWRR